jgi:hypothetical protein
MTVMDERTDRPVAGADRIIDRSVMTIPVGRMGPLTFGEFPRPSPGKDEIGFAATGHHARIGQAEAGNVQ